MLEEYFAKHFEALQLQVSLILQELNALKSRLDQTGKISLIDNLISKEAICRKLDICEKTFKKYCRYGGIKPIRLGRIEFYKKDEIEFFLENAIPKVS